MLARIARTLFGWCSTIHCGTIRDITINRLCAWCRSEPPVVGMFDAEGHILLTRIQFLERARTQPRRLVNNLLLAGTPRAFERYDEFCAFLEDVAIRLHVHPRSIAVCGSTQLGFSYKPQQDKVWLDMRPTSDIDLAVVGAV